MERETCPQTGVDVEQAVQAGGGACVNSKWVFQMAGASVIQGSERSLEEAVDDDDLLELGSTSNKESVAEVTFGGQLNENQAERLVGRFAALFTDKPGSTNMPNTKSS